MPNITPGNRLYIYQLLRREIGVGRQTLLSRVEEVFAADDLAPEDLGYDSVRELLEGLGDMVKLTVFKRGNTYATLVQNDEWDRMLAEPAGPSAQQKAAAKGKPWKHRSKAKVIRPTKPQRRRAVPAAEARGDAHETPADSQPGTETDAAAETEAPAEEREQTEEQRIEPKTASEATPDSPSEPEPEEVRVEATPEPHVEAPNAPDVSAPTGEDDRKPARTIPTPHIKLTVTYDPYAGIERDIAATERNLSEAVLETARTQSAVQATAHETPAVPKTEAETPPEAPDAERPAAKPAPEPTYTLLDEAEEAAVTPEPILVGLPRDFSSEVYVPNGPLSLLYQMLPATESPADALASDWQVARSTRSYRGTRNLVSFPLHVTHEDGGPVMVTLRRTTRPASGRHWAVVSVDGNDGSRALSEELGPKGLPESDLAVERALARSIDLGPWDKALASLAAVAEPERWDFPDRPRERGVLRLYLAMTYRAVLEQGLLATSEDGSFGTFDTGLLSPLSEHVYACLEAEDGDAPWRLAGFSTTGEGALGSHLESVPGLPAAPRYLSGFADLAVRPDDEVILSHGLARELGEDANELAAASVRRCAADYRLVAPAMDAENGKPCLLLPLASKANPSSVTRALSVERSSEGELRATGCPGLALAYAEARVVSRSVPDWLADRLG